MAFALSVKAIRRCAGAVLVLILADLAGAQAADLPRRPLDDEARQGGGPGPWRDDAFGRVGGRACTLADITPQYGPIVPTNSLCDPTYVGSAAGLSHPSHDGTLQPPAFRAFTQP